MRRFLVEPDVVEGLFPAPTKEEQRKLMMKRLKFHVTYDKEDDCFIIHSPKLVRFGFPVEYLPDPKDQMAIRRWNGNGVPLAPALCLL